MSAQAAVVEQREFQARLARLESLVEELASLPDPSARAGAEEVITTVLDLHGAGLARILELIAAGDGPPAQTLAALAADELVGSLLLLHGLHPVDLRTRVESALESVRPYMRSHGGNVELLGVEDEVVRLRLQGSCHGCPSSAMTLKLAVEKAVLEAAPDVAAIEVEGVTDPPAAAPQGLMPLRMAP